MRIVSLLPSATEILFELGLGDDVVGVTFECDFPDEARTKRIVSTSALPEDLTPAEIDAVVKERMAAGEDLYRLDRGASHFRLEPGGRLRAGLVGQAGAGVRCESRR